MQGVCAEAEESSDQQSMWLCLEMKMTIGDRASFEDIKGKLRFQVWFQRIVGSGMLHPTWTFEE